VTLGGMRWKRMKMEKMSLKVNSKWYGGLGKVQGLLGKLSDLPSVNTCPRHKEIQIQTYSLIC
jgi:hypothetical protein